MFARRWNTKGGTRQYGNIGYFHIPNSGFEASNDQIEIASQNVVLWNNVSYLLGDISLSTRQFDPVRMIGISGVR